MPNNEYLICTFIEARDTGETFTNWPLHITLVSWFATDKLPEFHKQIADALAQTQRIPVRVSEEKTWGPNTVNVIKPTQDLRIFHEGLLQCVRSVGRILINEQFMGTNYTPHVTHQDGEAVRPGDDIMIEDVYIIERNKSTQLKTILYKIQLVE